MSEAVGTIGQKYEDRRTKRVGMLVDRDEEKKTLQFLDNATGEPFTVSNSSFRSNWRKIKEDVAVEEVEVEENGVEETEAEENVSEDTIAEEEVVTMTDEEAMQNFIDEVGSVRDIHFMTNPMFSNITTLEIDGIEALVLSKEKSTRGISVTMLPDLYTYSDMKNHAITGTLRFDAENHLAVSFISDYTTFGEILQAIKEIAKEINLYGYTVE